MSTIKVAQKVKAFIARLLRKQSGSSVIEGALSIPLIFLVTAGVADIGFFEHKKLIAMDAVFQGARAGSAKSFTDILNACGNHPPLTTRCDQANYLNPNTRQVAIQTTCNFLTNNGEQAADWEVRTETYEPTFDGQGIFRIDVQATWLNPTCLTCFQSWLATKGIQLDATYLLEVDC